MSIYDRPEGFEKERADCTVRALSTISEIDYSIVHSAFKKFGRKNGCGVFCKKIFQKVCNELNIIAKQVKRSGSVEKFIREYPNGRFFCLKRGHAFPIINGKILDNTKINSHLKGAWLITEGAEKEQEGKE